MSYLCHRCKARPAMNGICYCRQCKREVVREMTEEGYLQKVYFGHAGDQRTREMKENTYETIHGTGH